MCKYLWTFILEYRNTAYQGGSAALQAGSGAVPGASFAQLQMPLSLCHSSKSGEHRSWRTLMPTGFSQRESGLCWSGTPRGCSTWQEGRALMVSGCRWCCPTAVTVFLKLSGAVIYAQERRGGTWKLVLVCKAKKPHVKSRGGFFPNSRFPFRS